MVYEGVFLLILFLSFVGTVLWLAVCAIEKIMRGRLPLPLHVAAALSLIVPVMATDRIWIAVRNDWLDGFRLAARIWLWGALIWGLAFVAIRIMTCLRVKGMPPCEDGRLKGILAAGARKLGVRTPTLRCGKLRTAACVCLAGVRHEVIISGDILAELNDEAIEQIFLHELTHIARGHLWMRTMVDLILCLHWMNPFLWLERRSLALRLEQDCDARVVSGRGGVDPASYMRTLLLSLKAQSRRRAQNRLYSSVQWGHYRFMKRRFAHLIHPASRAKRAAGLCLSVMLIILFAFASVGLSKEVLDSKHPITMGNPAETEYAANY